MCPTVTVPVVYSHELCGSSLSGMRVQVFYLQGPTQGSSGQPMRLSTCPCVFFTRASAGLRETGLRRAACACNLFSQARFGPLLRRAACAGDVFVGFSGAAAEACSVCLSILQKPGHSTRSLSRVSCFTMC